MEKLFFNMVDSMCEGCTLGVTLSDGKFMDKFQITCGSNVISFTKILALPGNISQENSSGYVSQKLVDYLKPLICQQEKPQQPQAKSDF